MIPQKTSSNLLNNISYVTTETKHNKVYEDIPKHLDDPGTVITVKGGFVKENDKTYIEINIARGPRMISQLKILPPKIVN